MKNDKMIIPSNIHVGYQKREDTYTGKLAYVIYKDSKGILRKELSWNSWRSKKIDIDIFDNVPTSGFVLNKKVGGYDKRTVWARIYDPRGFEFEISISNLIYILEETSSIKGKGLEGEFVYAWSGADLVLLPTTAKEYTNSVYYTGLQSKKIDKNIIKEGRLYLTKKNEKVLYLGRHDFLTYEYDFKYYYARNHRSSENLSYSLCINKKKNQHIFYIYEPIVKDFTDFNNNNNFINLSGFSNIAEQITEEISNEFPEKLHEFKNSIHGADLTELRFIETNEKIEDQTKNVNNIIFLGEDDNYCRCFAYFSPKIRLENFLKIRLEQDPIQVDYYSNPYIDVKYFNKNIDSLKIYKIKGFTKDNIEIDIFK